MRRYRFGLLVIGLVLGVVWGMILLLDPGLGVLNVVAVGVLVIILAPDEAGRRNWRRR